MKPPRDSQRSRLYGAESSAFTWGQTISDELLQATLNDILDRTPVRARWGHLKIRVERGRGGARAYNKSWISMGVAARNEWAMCHELAHCLTFDHCASHGPEFAGVYLFLIDLVIGKEAADRLRNAFKAKGVKYNYSLVPDPLPASRIPGRQYEPLKQVAKKMKKRGPSADRSAAAHKAWATRRAAARSLNP
jgi:hypothetical protein